MLNQIIGQAQAAISFPQITLIESGNTGFSAVVGDVVTWILFLAGILAVIYLIYGGLLYITAAGDAEKATKGRTALVNAIIGIIIIALAILIVRWVNSIITSGTAG